MQVTVTPPAPAEAPKTTAQVTIDEKGVAHARPAEQTTEAPKTDERPAWLPEKFKTPEDLAQAYKALEQKLSQPKVEKPQAPKADAPQTTDLSGLDTAKMAREIGTDGKLSDESIAALKAKGLDDAAIAVHVEGVKAVAAQFRSTLAQAIGGEERLQETSRWAAQNLSEAEAEALNAALASGNAALAGIALQGVYARMVAEVGSDGERIVGEATGAKGIQPFASSQEVVAAMRDPRYKSGDPAYHKLVQDRLAVSKLFQ